MSLVSTNLTLLASLPSRTSRHAITRLLSMAPSQRVSLFEDDRPSGPLFSGVVLHREEVSVSQRAAEPAAMFARGVRVVRVLGIGEVGMNEENSLSAAIPDQGMRTVDAHFVPPNVRDFERTIFQLEAAGPPRDEPQALDVAFLRAIKDELCEPRQMPKIGVPRWKASFRASPSPVWCRVCMADFGLSDPREDDALGSGDHFGIARELELAPTASQARLTLRRFPAL